MKQKLVRIAPSSRVETEGILDAGTMNIARRPGRWAETRMARMLCIALGALAGGALATAAAVTVGHLIFKRKVSREIRDIFAHSTNLRPTIVAEAELAQLPEPVQRWLRSAGVVGTERPLTVRLKQHGLFRQKEGQRWMPIDIEEYYTTDPPQFIWFATMKMAPLISTVGRDKYVAGKGEMDIRLLSLLRVVHAQGPELDQGALLRYLNEILWFPAAALSPYITWEGIDATSARATMSYGGVSGTATFTFTEAGDPTTMVTEKYRPIDGGFELDKWSTPLSAYGEFHGIRIPVEAEAMWKLPSGDFPYVHVRVTDVEYNHPALYERGSRSTPPQGSVIDQASEEQGNAARPAMSRKG